jgi:hypothetical protein
MDEVESPSFEMPKWLTMDNPEFIIGWGPIRSLK